MEDMKKQNIKFSDLSDKEKSLLIYLECCQFQGGEVDNGKLREGEKPLIWGWVGSLLEYYEKKVPFERGIYLIKLTDLGFKLSYEARKSRAVSFLNENMVLYKKNAFNVDGISSLKKLKKKDVQLLLKLETYVVDYGGKFSVKNFDEDEISTINSWVGTIVDFFEKIDSVKIVVFLTDYGFELAHCERKKAALARESS